MILAWGSVLPELQRRTLETQAQLIPIRCRATASLVVPQRSYPVVGTVSRGPLVTSPFAAEGSSFPENRSVAPCGMVSSSHFSRFFGLPVNHGFSPSQVNAPRGENGMETGERAPTRMQMPVLGLSPGLGLVLLRCPAALPASPHPQVCAHPPVSPVTPSFPRSQMLGSVSDLFTSHP